jgi:hypothetical protein
MPSALVPCAQARATSCYATQDLVGVGSIGRSPVAVGPERTRWRTAIPIPREAGCERAYGARGFYKTGPQPV